MPSATGKPGRPYRPAGMTVKFPADPGRFCITDVGSTTTKAILFRRDGHRWRFERAEAPTTVEKPHEDVTVGVTEALRRLEHDTGEMLLRDGTPAVPLLATSSAGGGLAMVVTGLVKDITARTADRVALGAGAIVLDVLAMNDHRTPYWKIEQLKRLRPDMVLLAGGFDGDALAAPVYLAELILESELKPKLNPTAKLAVIYAGNRNATEYVRKVLADRYLFVPVENVRPAGDRVNMEPARAAIHDLFMDHVMSQAPGYDRLKEWVAAPIEPTPAAFGRILSLVSKQLGQRILAVDIGGATTDVFTVERGSVTRTVSANLGMSYSILNVALTAGVTSIRVLYPDGPDERELWNRIGNKHIDPTGLPGTFEDMNVEWATATVAVREAVRQHFEVLFGPETPGPNGLDLTEMLTGRRHRGETRPPLQVGDYDLVIGSGGILSHSPRAAAAMVLLDALQPDGVVELAVDSAFMFPHLGVLGAVNPELARTLFDELGLVRLGTVCAPAGDAAVHARGVTVNPGEVRALEADGCEEVVLTIDPAGTGPVAEQAVRGGAVGVIVDNRGRPVEGSGRALLGGIHTPPSRQDAPGRGERVRTGELRVRRELAITGRTFVRTGERVVPETLVARSERQFLRPFFVDVAGGLGVPPAELARYLEKKIGDEVDSGTVIAKKRRRWVTPKLFASNVRGRIEKILPSGVLVIRESPEQARALTAVHVAKEMDMEPGHLEHFLRVEVGQEVDRGQWLASTLTEGFRFCASPVRGRVHDIDRHFGIVLIAPLLEEEEVHAWLPGVVEEVTERGCVVKNEGTVISGAWGRGGEAWGALTFEGPARGQVLVCDFADHETIVRARAAGSAGLVAAGLDLVDVLSPDPGVTIVVLVGFGRREMPRELRRLFENHRGGLVLLDGTTQLRVGVHRPRVILPGAGPGGVRA